jgi:hypothetical protein
LHGVPANLDLSAFVNTTLQRIDFGPYIIHLNFDGDRTVISVEGDWELRDGSGDVIDRSSNDPAKAYRLPLLAGKTVTSTEIDPPTSFSLVFDSGHELRIFDNSKEFESFAIQPGDIFV